jgi:hypothetical protein
VRSNAEIEGSADDVLLPPSYHWAGFVALVVMLLYLLTLAPTIGLWDSGEYVAAAFGLGIPHPPGNPGFVLLGRVVSLLPIASTVAGRLNILVALASALSAGLWFLITEHVARTWWSPMRTLWVAGAASLIGATAFTVWNQSVVNEKVYTVSLFLLTLDLWSVLRWQAAPNGTRADRGLVLLCYRLGIGYTVHIAGLLAGPALLAAVLYTKPGTLRRSRLLMVCAGAFVLGLTPYVALPIRSAFRLELNEGHPTACEDGVPQWGCTLSRETVNRFLYENNRTQYAKPSLLARQASLPDQVAMWWLYFKWQWFRDPMAKAAELQSTLAVVMLLLAGLGGYAHWRTDRRSFVPFATLVATITAGLIYYLNFKLGYTQAATMNVQGRVSHEVRDRDYFYLWSYSALSVWIGLGLAEAWRRFAEFLAGLKDDDRGRVEPTTTQWRITAVVFAVAFIPLVVNWTSASRHDETFPEDFAVDVLNSVEPNGVLFTGGDNDSFPLWYAQQVLGVRRDVTIVLTAYLSTDWYIRELIAKEPQPYDPATGPALFRQFPRTGTTRVLAMSRQTADSIPADTRTFSDTKVRLPGFDVDIPASFNLTRDAIVMLRIIHDAGAIRPIYFSSGLGSVVVERMLSGHVVNQGLVRKLVADPASAPGVVRHGNTYFDAPRVRDLWKTFRGPDALVRQGRWIDAASANTPYAYMRTGIALTLSLDSARATQAAGDLRLQLARIAHAVDFNRFDTGGKAALEAPTGLGYAPVTGR